MIPLSLEQVAEAVDGQLIGESCTIALVSTDTRSIDKGALFIALVGPSFDGHLFAERALESGAAALIVSRRLDISLPQVLVDDTQQALGALGAYVRQQVSPKTVAITGSNGKTTTKEMVAAILRQKGNVLTTAGNFNNEIGVPLTLLRLEPQHKYAVIELGANHKGEIAYTSSLTKPDVALINNVMPAHLEGFGSIQGVAQAKSEIFAGLPRQGAAIVNGDSDFFDYWQNRITDKELYWFSVDKTDAFVYASDIHMDELGYATFTLNHQQQSVRIQLPVPGRHNVANALAAVTVSLQLDCTLTEIATGIAQMELAKGRLKVSRVSSALSVIDDSYNANLDSAKAAIDLLAIYPDHRICVVGDMGELGEKARSYHQELGEYALAKGIQQTAALGVLSLHTAQGAAATGYYFENKASLYAWLDQQLAEFEKKGLGVTILVKGSRSAHMEEVVAYLDADRQRNKAC